MLREPGSKYEHKRSGTLLKLKMFQDAEARVVGYKDGAPPPPAVALCCAVGQGWGMRGGCFKQLPHAVALWDPLKAAEGRNAHRDIAECCGAYGVVQYIRGGVD